MNSAETFEISVSLKKMLLLLNELVLFEKIKFIENHLGKNDPSIKIAMDAIDDLSKEYHRLCDIMRDLN